MTRAERWASLTGAPEDGWVTSHKFDAHGATLADGHYSRRKPGSPQFMPPGQTVVLVNDHAVFGWWRPDPKSGLRAMNGLDGWTCSLFRNTGPTLSSALVLLAEKSLVALGMDCGPDGLLTYVFDKKIRSVNPGCCFKKAGWRIHERRSADGRKTLLYKPFALAGVAP